MTDCGKTDQAAEVRGMIAQLTGNGDLQNASKCSVSQFASEAMYQVTYRNAAGEQETHFYFKDYGMGLYDFWLNDSHMPEKKES